MPGLADQHDEQVECLARKRDRLAAQQQQTLARYQHERTEAIGRALVTFHAPPV
jgi:hypothetical protein